MDGTQSPFGVAIRGLLSDQRVCTASIVHPFARFALNAVGPLRANVPAVDKLLTRYVGSPTFEEKSLVIRSGEDARSSAQDWVRRAKSSYSQASRNIVRLLSR